MAQVSKLIFMSTPLTSILLFIDDLTSEKFAMNAGLMGYEGAKQGSKHQGIKEQVCLLRKT